MKTIIEPNPELRLTPKQIEKREGRGFAYHQSTQSLYKLKLLLRNLETQPELYVNGIKKIVYKIPRLINFLKILELAKEGKMKVHGGAVAINDKHGILISGLHDIGKTTLVLRLTQSGYYILGDDGVLVSRDGRINRIQNRGGIYPHPDNLKGLDLSPIERLMGRLRYYLSRIPLIVSIFKINPNYKVSYAKIGKTLDEVNLHKVFILEKGEPSITEIGLETAIRKLMTTSINLSKPDGFPIHMFYKYCFANNLRPTLLEDRWYQILTSGLRDKKIFVITGRKPDDFYKLFVQNENR